MPMLPRHRAEQARTLGLAPPGKESFETAAQQYLRYQKGRISTANYRREVGIVEQHLKPFFAGQLAAIRRAMVARYVTARCGDVSRATVAKELNVLKHLLRLAVEECGIHSAESGHRSQGPQAGGRSSSVFTARRIASSAGSSALVAASDYRPGSNNRNAALGNLEAAMVGCGFERLPGTPPTDEEWRRPYRVPKSRSCCLPRITRTSASGLHLFGAQ